jgi:hypothetical protein
MIPLKIIKCSIFSILDCILFSVANSSTFSQPDNRKIRKIEVKGTYTVIIKLISFQHLSLNDWRENFIGVRMHHQATGLDIAGAVDDIWVNSNNVLYVVHCTSSFRNQCIGKVPGSTCRDKRLQTM